MNTTGDAINLPEPVIKKQDGRRAYSARYDTGRIKKAKYEFEQDKQILFTLSVSYSKAGINYFSGERTTTDYFSVSVINETQEGSMIGFTMGSGLGVARIPQPNNRFSRKKLDEIFEEWREKIEGMLSLDEQQLHLLDDDEQKIRAAILPYWNGTQA